MRVACATQAARSATPSRASTVVGASAGAAARGGAGWPAAATPAALSGATSPVSRARWTKVRRRMWRYSSRYVTRLAGRAGGGGDGLCGGCRSGAAVRVPARLRRSDGGVPRVVVPGDGERRRRRGAGLLARLPHRRARARRELGRRARRPPGPRRQSRRGRLHHLPGPRDSRRRRHRRGLFHRLRAEGIAELGQVAARRAGGRRRLAGLHAAVLLGRRLRRHPGQLRLRRRRRLAGHRDRRHPGGRLRAGRHPRHAAGGAVHLRRSRRRRSLARRGGRPDRRDPEGRSRDRGRRRRTRGPRGRRGPRRAAASCLPVRLRLAGVAAHRRTCGRGTARRQRRLPPHRRDAVQRRQPRERHQVAAMGRGLGPGVQPAADPGRARLDARPRHAHPRARARVARLEQPAAEPAAAARDARRGHADPAARARAHRRRHHADRAVHGRVGRDQRAVHEPRSDGPVRQRA